MFLHMISSISSIRGIHSHLHLQAAEIKQTSWPLQEEKGHGMNNNDDIKNEKARDGEAVFICTSAFCLLKHVSSLTEN